MPWKSPPYNRADHYRDAGTEEELERLRRLMGGMPMISVLERITTLETQMADKVGSADFTALSNTVSALASAIGLLAAQQRQNGTVTLDGNGEATWTFPTAYTTEPGITLSYLEAGTAAQPIVVKVKSKNKTGANWTSVTVRGVRARAIPTNLVSLLLGGVFDIFGAPAPAGVQVDLDAAVRTA